MPRFLVDSTRVHRSPVPLKTRSTTASVQPNTTDLSAETVAPMSCSRLSVTQLTMSHKSFSKSSCAAGALSLAETPYTVTSSTTTNRRTWDANAAALATATSQVFNNTALNKVVAAAHPATIDESTAKTSE